MPFGEYIRPEIMGGGIVYVCKGHVIGGEPIESGPETLEVKWFPAEALPSSLPGFQREYIQDAKANAAVPLKKRQKISFFQAIFIRILLQFRDLRNGFPKRR